MIASALYAVFAATRQVVTGPSASVAAVTAPVAALYVAWTAPEYLATVIALTLCVGVIYVLWVARRVAVRAGPKPFLLLPIAGLIVAGGHPDVRAEVSRWPRRNGVAVARTRRRRPTGRGGRRLARGWW